MPDEKTVQGRRMTERPIEVAVHSYSNPELHRLYDELFDEEPCLIIDREVASEGREALEVEARCYGIGEPRGRLKFCYAPRSYEARDWERIRALRRCVEDVHPEWVEQVRMATLMDNEIYTIVHLSGVPPYPAVAILENMRDRGELPQVSY
jgi:hypothetical protein